MSRTKGSQDYSQTVKLKAVKMYLEEGLTQPVITARLGIRDPGRVQKWLQAYRREGEQAFSPERRHRSGRPRKPRDPSAYIAQLEMEVELLKKAHSEARRCAVEK
jgi:transposase